MSLFSNQRNERISYTLPSHGFDFNDVVRASWRLKLLPATLLLFQNIILIYDKKHIKSLHYSSLCGDRWVYIIKGHWRRKCDHAITTVYPKKYAHGFVVLCFVVVMQSFIMNSHEVFIHIHQGCYAGTGAIVRLPQCQWSKPDGYGTTSQFITTTKHNKAKTVCIFLGIYCLSCTVGCLVPATETLDIRSH